MVCTAVALAIGALAWALQTADAVEPSGPPAAPPAEPSPSAPRHTAGQAATLPAPVALAMRVEGVRRLIPVTPVVVLVPDAETCVDALGAWSLRARDDGTFDAVRFPVLIDDGSWQAREHIARFVRAFRPDRVLRLASTRDRWPAEEAARRQRLFAVMERAWGVPASAERSTTDPTAALRAHWRDVGFQPPGAVVTHLGDPAWPAALALAAAHGQVLALLPRGAVPVDPSTPLTFEQLLELDRGLRYHLVGWGFPFDRLGDAVDAVTLVLSCSPRVNIAPADPLAPRAREPFRLPPDRTEPLALTDLIGRSLPDRADQRWAWASQLPGDAPRAVYAAMCALFLRPTSAAGFDGYEARPPWNTYAVAQALATFRDAGFTVHDWSGQARTPAEFRRAAAGGMAQRPLAAPGAGGGVEAHVITINTSGMQSFFEVQGGQLLPCDVPLLRHPAIVNMVHSWSAVAPANRFTIAGRWFDRGAYAYIGSVHEPYLAAFLPTPLLAQRLLAPAVLSAAARNDAHPPWRVAIFGDALLTIAPDRQPLPRLALKPDQPPPIPGLDAPADLGDELREALAQRRFNDAVALLHLLGRDRDLARLVGAVIAEARGPEVPLSPDAAAAGALGAYRAGDRDTMLRAAVLARPALDQGRWADLADAVWHTLDPGWNSVNAEQAELLAACIRADMIETFRRDVQELGGGVMRSLGRAPARELLHRLREAARSEPMKQEVDRVLNATGR